jgi:hypothetical protein
MRYGCYVRVEKQYHKRVILFLTREHKTISTRNRVMFCLLYGLIQSDKNTFELFLIQT